MPPGAVAFSWEGACRRNCFLPVPPWGRGVLPWRSTSMPDASCTDGRTVTLSVVNVGAAPQPEIRDVAGFSGLLHGHPMETDRQIGGGIL